MEEKKEFLLNSSLLYNNILKNSDNNCIRRFLAFKIINNTMSFEDLVNNRTFNDFRQIRNVFLAHKQENNFFEAHSASEKITDKNIQLLIDFMKSNIQDYEESERFKELSDNVIKDNLDELSAEILNLFKEEFYSGFRISNNFLCTDSNQIKELSSNKLSGVFYRYNSSKEIGILTNYFITNLSKNPHFRNALLNFKIDYLLHSVNMYDCIFEDKHNRFSIKGLYEILEEENMDGTEPLKKLKENESHLQIYGEMRELRNKLAGHMDSREPLSSLLSNIDTFDIEVAYDFVNTLDRAVFDSKKENILVQHHYDTFNMKVENSDIVSIENGLSNKDYFD